MVIFKCKMCGGDLNIEEGMTVCECEYCGTKQTVPALDNEKKVNLFNRANRLRFNCEFDKAAGVYESIVAEFPKESEAYWGLCLCKYGIEYVDDPATAKKIPTCHRTSYDSIFQDGNFDLACECADGIAQSVIRDEAKEIDRLQKAILDIAGREEPFDVFICYKETADDGQRTKDSVMAQNIFDALTDKGYKVFFSRVTLEDKLGQEYEPYIFAALNSAKVMLAIGTKFEYYNAVWVKNEWSRFLYLMKNDKSKVLIPCYADIDAYDMPEEFKHLQGQDMGKVGFIQDLVRGIGKIVPLKNDENVRHDSIPSTAPIVETIIKHAYICLEDGQWQKVYELSEQILDYDPENYNAYFVRLLATHQMKTIQELRSLENPIDNDLNFKNTIRFCDEKLKAELTECSEYINKTVKFEQQMQTAYNNFVSFDRAKEDTEIINGSDKAFNKMIMGISLIIIAVTELLMFLILISSKNTPIFPMLITSCVAGIVSGGIIGFFSGSEGGIIYICAGIAFVLCCVNGALLGMNSVGKFIALILAVVIVVIAIAHFVKSASIKSDIGRRKWELDKKEKELIKSYEKEVDDLFTFYKDIPQYVKVKWQNITSTEISRKKTNRHK